MSFNIVIFELIKVLINDVFINISYFFFKTIDYCFSISSLLHHFYVVLSALDKCPHNLLIYRTHILGSRNTSVVYKLHSTCFL